ncbi:MAG: cob(I)yrinic acid a,c-diamide adenosyltransferase [Candidatus Omnitrophota bacterium]
MLQIKNLTCGYEEKEIIRDVSFSVREGEFLGIIGPNGSGKTTLFRAITGILRPWKGGIQYKGEHISKISTREFSREAAVIPQILEVPFAFTVEEFVLMGRFPYLGRFEALRAKDLEVLEEALALTDIAGLRQRKISELSGGERQRAIFAQGLAQEPSLLLLDEPTAHLDIAHQVQILDLVKRLNREKGLTVIVVLHDLNLASSYCDRLVLLKEGEIFKDGLSEEVLTYQNIEEVYKTVVVVEKNPISGKPYIFLVSQKEKNKKNKFETRISKSETKGLIQVYTGEGKGKTTAAVGLACRARGHDLRVCYVCFHKDPDRWGQGEHRTLKKIGVDIFRFAKKHPCFHKNVTNEEVRQGCLEGLEFIKKIYGENKYNILILDEINVSLKEGFIREKELLEVLSAKPRALELILTGRGVTKKVIEKADLVSEIKKVKHPYDLGIKIRKGIEY